MRGRRPSRSRGSHFLHRFDELTGRPVLAVAVVGANVVWLGLSAGFGFPAHVEVVYSTVVNAITLAVLFVIQHTQAREQAATQRKLDGILAALPGADDSLVNLEDAGDDELAQAGERHRATRHAWRSGAGRPGGSPSVRDGHARAHRPAPAPCAASEHHDE